MCGRFTITVTYEELKQYVQMQYQIPDLDKEFKVPNFNVAPGMDIISVIHDGKKNRIGLLKWGFVPTFSKDQKVQIINAKAETIMDKPSFKQAAMNQRCTILADGFYEWKQDKDKQPMRITTNQRVFAMAGIWNTITTSEGKKIHTVAIITTQASEKMGLIHQRMPVILDQESEKLWLDADNHNLAQLQGVLKPYQGELHIYPVSKKVNSAANNTPELLLDISQE
jgi:putative SOS response-associated peptidase YedK